jgi:hypothetical protein
MAMDVVQVHDIRPDPFQFRDHILGRLPGMKAIVSRYFGFQCLKLDVAVACTGDTQRVAVASAAEDIVFDICGSQKLADADAYLACAANATGGIDLNYFHPIVSQKK